MSRAVKLLIIALLTVVTILSAIFIWFKYTPSQPIEVLLTPEPEVAAEIYVGGAVNNPGIYPLKAGDDIETLLQAAGGCTTPTDPGQLQLLVVESDEAASPQKIDINRAEAWLLQALPGIGETRAQAIVDHRHQNGPFRSINELTKISGIGAATYDAIKELITVTDGPS
jgi:competence protein ComEA